MPEAVSKPERTKKLLPQKGWRLYTALVLLTALPLVLFLYASDRFVRRLTTRNLLQSSSNAADLAAKILEERMQRSSGSLQAFADDPAILSAWQHHDLARVDSYIQSASKLRPDITALAIYDSTGARRITIPTDAPQLVEQAGTSDWFTGAMKDHKVYITGATNGQQSASRMVVAVPMQHENPAGVLAAIYNVSTVNGWLSALPASTTKWIALVDRNGATIAGAQLPASASRSASEQNEVKKLLAGQGGTEYTLHEGRKVLVTRRPIPSLGWGLLVEIPESEIDKALWNFERPIALIGAVFILLGMLTGAAFAWMHRRLRRSQEETRRVAKELEIRNRELESFAYSLSHDVRAPLRHVDGFARILAEDHGYDLPAEARDLLSKIQVGAHRTQQLIDALLRFYRVGGQGLRMQSTDLNQLAEEVITGLKRDLGERNVTFEVSHLSQVTCDRGLTTQVFWNLLANAVKFTGPQPQARIRVGEQLQNGKKAFFVQDNGVGFDMEHAGKLFTPFHRLHAQEDFEGTGIGLATVQRIVQKHNGEIWVTSTPGQGSTFYFTLGNNAA